MTQSHYLLPITEMMRVYFILNVAQQDLLLDLSSPCTVEREQQTEMGTDPVWATAGSVHVAHGDSHMLKQRNCQEPGNQQLQRNLDTFQLLLGSKQNGDAVVCSQMFLKALECSAFRLECVVGS